MLNAKQLRILFKAKAKIGGFTTLSPKEALSARALDRHGFGTYTRDDDGPCFRINDRGRTAVSGGSPITVAQATEHIQKRDIER